MKYNTAFLLILLFIISTSLPAFSQSGQQEICNNGIDDDGDGFIDLNDPDCICNQSQVNSLIPNHSFEDYSECPSGLHQIDKAVPWIQPTAYENHWQATTDYINTCGHMGDAGELLPFPDGNGLAGCVIEQLYKEYVGTCLESPLQAGKPYRITFNVAAIEDGPPACKDGDMSAYEALDLTIYGTQKCEYLPAKNTQDYPTTDPNWVVLGHARYKPESNWSLVTIAFTPKTDINAFMLGGPEVLPPTYPVWDLNTNTCYPYFFFDNLILNSGSAFGLEVTQSGNLCDNNLILNATPTQPLSNLATYQWYKEGIAITGAVNPTYNIVQNNNAYGIYALRITDGNDCFTGYTEVNADLLAPKASSVPVCKPGTGSIAITTPAPFYSFDKGETWTADPIAQNLTVGFYGVRIKNEQGCISDPTYIEVKEFTLPAPDFEIIQPKDCVNGWKITITTPASEYSFDNGSTWQDVNFISGLLGGDYRLRVKNQDGCVSDSVFTHINEFFTLAPTYIAAQPNCSTDGSLTITTLADAYSIDGGTTWQNEPLFDNLISGYYEMKVKYNNGCISYSSYQLIAPAETLPDAPLVTVQQPLSCLIPFGKIIITTQASQYSFDNGLTWINSNTSTNLTPGTYRVKIKNAAGCQSPDTIVTINPPADIPVTPLISVIQPTCSQPKGTITISTISDQYSFDNGTSWETTNTRTGLAAGSYTVKIRNTAGCESEGIEAVINAINLPLKPLVSNIIYCEGDVASALIANGVNLLWYSEENGNTGSSTSPIPDTNTTGTTSYYVSQTVDGCESEKAVLLVTINAIPSLPITESTIVYCQHHPAEPLTATGTNLLWYTSASGTGTTIAPTPSTEIVGSTVYFVSEYNDGCESGLVAITVVVNPAPEAPEVTSPVIYNYNDKALPLVAKGQNIAWYDSDMNFISYTPPVPPTNQTGETIYYAVQILGCTSLTAEVIVNVVPEDVAFNYPKFFTPNGDNVNERWNITDLKNQKNAKIYVFDCYGKVIIALKPNELGWDGTYYGYKLPATDYWFKVLYFENGSEQEFKAHFSLIR